MNNTNSAENKEEVEQAVNIYKDFFGDLFEAFARFFKDFVEAFVPVFQDICIAVISAVKQIFAALKHCPSKRVVYLAFHHPKKRVRKKNMRRILKWIERG